MGAYAAVLLLAGALRFWDLGSRALHHDESIHAVFAWQMFTGRAAYQHDPTYHGPLLYHLMALGYFLFGVSDYTARIVTAAAGTALVGAPLLLRHHLGRPGTLAAMVLLAVSPSLLYFSRFVRHDILLALWTVLLVVCLWRYLESADRRWLYGFAAALSLAFATKEVAYILALIFALYLALRVVGEWGGRGHLRTIVRRLLGRSREAVPWRRLVESPAAGLLILLVTLVMPLGGALAGLFQDHLGLVLVRYSPAYGWPEGIGVVVAWLITAGLFLLSAAVGMWWNRSVWLRGAAVFWTIFFVLFTAMLSDMTGFASGVWRSLGHWLAQHAVERGAQPAYYYLLLMPIYEFLGLALALGGALYYWRRRHSADPGRLALFAFLLFWLVLMWVALSISGEKMPWLSVHLALPLALMGGLVLSELLGSIDWRAAWASRGIYILALVPLALLGLRGAASPQLPPESGDAPAFTRVGERVLALLAVGVPSALIYLLGRRYGLRRSLQMAALAAIAVLFAFTVRAAWQASYKYGDIPVEMIVYTQTAPDIPDIARDIERLSRETGLGKELPIIVDSTDSFSWPWAWYLRDYTKVSYEKLVNGGSPSSMVLLLNERSKNAISLHEGNYGPGRPYVHRWWFDEGYKELNWSILWSRLTSRRHLKEYWNYFLYRKTAVPSGSVNGIAYFPRNFYRVGEPGTRPSMPSDYEYLPLAARAVSSIGGRGTAQGALRGPRDLALDGEGNLYVLEAAGHRLRKFDAQGRELASVGGFGSGAGQFNEPWGLAVSDEGFVYVADTWNHRIQKFDSQLNFVAQWGKQMAVFGDPHAGPGRFYGPRDIAIDAKGRLLVTDTGNMRVQVFDPNGEFLGVFGGEGTAPGKFREPVGIAVDSQGRVVVADTWNHRIQWFDSRFQFLREVPVFGWEGRSVVNKPYLAVTADDAVVASDPEAGRLVVYTASGAIAGSIGNETLGRALELPIGVAVDASGRLYVAEANGNRVQVLERGG